MNGHSTLPTLKLIDLSKGSNHDHPDIKTTMHQQYLIRHGGRYWCGYFTREHYGLNFIGWVNPIGLQYDKPGTNASGWEAIWSIDE